MKTSALQPHDLKNLPLVLVVDKLGLIGEGLANSLSQDFLIVFLSPEINTQNKNIIHIPFKKKIPEVPDNNYEKIFLVDDGSVITRQSVFSFIQIARKNNAPLFFIGGIRNIDISHADEIKNTYTNSKVLIFGDLFDNKIVFDKNSSIDKYIIEARKTGNVLVPGNGLSLNFPISLTDTIKLIVKASYIDIPQKVILLFYQYPITDISLANMLKKIYPELRIDFRKEERDRKIYIPTESQHAISRYPLEERLRELELGNKSSDEVRILKTSSGRKNYLKPLLFVAFILLFLVLLPLLTTSAYSLLGAYEINNAKNAAEKGDLEKGIRNADNAKTFFGIAKSTSGILVSEASLLGGKHEAEIMVNKIQAGQDLSLAVSYLLQGGSTLKNIYNGKSSDPSRDFDFSSGSFKSALLLIQKVRAEGELPPEFEQKFKQIYPLISLFSSTSDTLPDILGFNKEKKYLVLFQNNMELRPGGGFIGSFAILTLKNAKVSDFKISDVYTTDGQLKTHVEPPFPIRRYLPSAHLYLRDSNFDPDFVSSAISASNIYSLETKDKVDGVIGIDLSFAKDIIAALGPINVTDYNQVINENNLFQITEQKAEDNFFPGSTQKKDFLSALAKSIKQNLNTRKDIPYVGLAEKLGESITSKDLVFAFAESSYQNVFTANDFSSSLWDNRENADNQINDYFGISEANLGVNKVNYFVSRSISKKTIIDVGGKVSSNATIAFKNSSKQGDKGGGSYKNYMRIILPKGSIVSSILVNGKKVEIRKAITDYFIYETKGFKPPVGLEVDETTEMGKSLFGFLVNVAPGSVETISVNYTLPYSVSRNSKSITYSLKVYKQPGVDSLPFDLNFTLPPNYQIINSKNYFSQEITGDQNLNFNISQK